MLKMNSSVFPQAFLCGVLIVSFASFAHGPAPAPLNVLKVSDDGTVVLLTSNIGLFHQNDGVFRYRCPSLWDENNDGEYDQTTPFVAASSDELLVAGDPFVYASDDDACSFSALPDLAGPAVRNISSSGDHVFLLLKTDEGSAIWSRSANAVVWETSSSLVSLKAANGSLWAAGVDREAEKVLLIQLPISASVQAPFDEVSSISFTAPAESGSPQHVELRYFDDDGHAWATVTTATGVELWRFEQDRALKIDEATAAIQGPVPICDGIGYAKEGRLIADPQHPFSCDDEVLDEETLRCLVHRDGFSFACFGFEMFRLQNEEGRLTTLKVFSFAQIEGPDVSCLKEDEARRCASAWAYFGAESGFLDDENDPPSSPETEPPEPTSNLFSCRHTKTQAASTATSGFGLLFLAMVFKKKRRLRRRLGEGPLHES